MMWDSIRLVIDVYNGEWICNQILVIITVGHVFIGKLNILSVSIW